jgi:excisionase family DNA binding protein
MSNAKLNQSNPRLSITVPDAARATGFSANYVRLLIARRELPHVRVGRAVRVLIVDLETFLQQHRQAAYEPALSRHADPRAIAP